MPHLAGEALALEELAVIATASVGITVDLSYRFRLLKVSRETTAEQPKRHFPQSEVLVNIRGRRVLTRPDDMTRTDAIWRHTRRGCRLGYSWCVAGTNQCVESIGYSL